MSLLPNIAISAAFADGLFCEIILMRSINTSTLRPDVNQWLLCTARLALLFALCMHPLLSSRGSTFVVPREYSNAEGEGVDQMFVAGRRIQTIYEGVNFLEAMPEGGLITEVAFRNDGRFGTAVNATANDFEVRLSTTTSTAPSVPFPWERNTGPDVTTVFPKGDSLPLRVAPTPGNLNEFALRIPFTTPFFYDPRNGNLLVDMLYSGGGLFAGLLVDATFDTAAQAYSGGVSSSTVFSKGPTLIMQLTFQPVPEPRHFWLAVMLYTGVVVLRRSA